MNMSTRLRDEWTTADPLEELLTDKGASLAVHERVAMRRGVLLERLVTLLRESGYLCMDHADESPEDCRACEAEELSHYLKESKHE